MNEAKKRKIILALTAVAVAVVFFFAGFGTGYGTGKGANDAPTADAPALGTGGGLIVSPVEDGPEEGKGIAVVSAEIPREQFDDYGIMPIAETAYTVTATVNGDGLTDAQKNVTWSAPAFKNPSSSWASGKNVSNYVTTSTNGNQITVSCLKAFGEQIVIKCTSSYIESASKELTVDYVKRMTEYSMKVATQDFFYGNFSSSFKYVRVARGLSIPVHMPNYKSKGNNPSVSGSWMYSYFCFPLDGCTWGTGTIENSLTSIRVVLWYKPAFASSMGFGRATTVTDISSNNPDITSINTSDNNILQQWKLLYGMAGSFNYNNIFGTTASEIGDQSAANKFLDKLDTENAPIQVKLFFSFQVGDDATLDFYLDPQIEPIT